MSALRVTFLKDHTETEPSRERQFAAGSSYSVSLQDGEAWTRQGIVSPAAPGSRMSLPHCTPLPTDTEKPTEKPVKRRPQKHAKPSPKQSDPSTGEQGDSANEGEGDGPQGPEEA